MKQKHYSVEQIVAVSKQAELGMEELSGDHALLKRLTKMLVEHLLGTEMADHSGHGKSGED
jgi:transposase-like protein